MRKSESKKRTWRGSWQAASSYWITGASSGIGLATAKLLVEHYARVVLVSRSKEKLEKLSKELPLSIAIDADITKIPEIKRVVEQTEERLGRIDVLINNAGQGYDAPCSH